MLWRGRLSHYNPRSSFFILALPSPAWGATVLDAMENQMIKSTMFGLLLASGTMAVAQTATPPSDPLSPTTTTGTTTATQPAPPIGPSAGTTTTPASPAVPATPADPASGNPAIPATPATPASPSANSTTDSTTSGATAESVVSGDWAKYDANANQQLSRTEFNKWVTDLQSAAGGKAPTRGYLTSAFAKADSNKNGSVSQTELTAFLGS